MRTKYTQGDWKYRYDADGDHAIYVGDTHIATTVGEPNMTYEEDRANAQLIASAPRLRATLAEIALDLQQCNKGKGSKLPLLLNILEKIEAALHPKTR